MAVKIHDFEALSSWLHLQWADLIEAMSPNHYMFAPGSAADMANVQRRQAVEERAVNPEEFSGKLTTYQKQNLIDTCQYQLVIIDNVGGQFNRDPGLHRLVQMRVMSAISLISMIREVEPSS